jgi:hypothetical protein
MGVTKSRRASLGQQHDEVRVEFAANAGRQVITRPLRQVRGNTSRPRLRAGDEVPVAYRPDAPAGAVLLYPHENYAAAPWTSVAGVGLLVVGVVLAAASARRARRGVGPTSTTLRLHRASR